MDYKLELVAIPVSDVDRAKNFYTEKAGFHADHDHRVNDQIRFVQLTPPGSACSIALGKGLVATLLNDQQLASDLHALITNLRAHGVLFYRDSAATTQTKPPEQTKRARQSPSR